MDPIIHRKQYYLTMNNYLEIIEVFSLRRLLNVELQFSHHAMSQLSLDHLWYCSGLAEHHSTEQLPSFTIGTSISEA